MSNFNQPFLYHFKLTNSNSVINLPYPLEKNKKIKVNSCRYTTASSNNDNVMIKINGFNDNIYFDGNLIHKCVKVIPLPNDQGSQLIYENQFPDSFDVHIEERRQNTGITSLRIEILINLQNSTDININNPFYLELKIF